MSDKRLCTVYKSLREDEMYLFVDREDDLSRVPELLLEKFGTPQRVTQLVLTPERKLARAEAPKVLEAIDSQGFYLQMPPPKYVVRDEAMKDMSQRNEKLPR
jgi:uncharacterized protein YcgL (UPF0745 family)